LPAARSRLGSRTAGTTVYTASRFCVFPLLPTPPAIVAPCADPLPEPSARGLDAAPAHSASQAHSASRVDWADVGRAHEPDVSLSLEWALFQLLPSPEFAVGDGGARFGMQWQVTPVLYSFATDARLSRWRWFVAEPLVRHSGSIELFASPEYLALEGGLQERWGVRAGVRSYFGLLGRGDNLAVSVGSAYVHFAGVNAVSYEAGAYILFGSLGVQLAYSPGFDAARSLMTLRLRYF
jgi:hypothetical protein